MKTLHAAYKLIAIGQSECPIIFRYKPIFIQLYNTCIFLFHMFLDLNGPVNDTIAAVMYSSVRFPISVVNSFPKARFAWRIRKHGSSELDEKIVDGENDGRLLISQSGDLYIVGVRSEDTGTYTCVVSNPFVDNAISVEFVLTVLEGGSSLKYTKTVPPFSAVLRSETGNASPVPHLCSNMRYTLPSPTWIALSSSQIFLFWPSNGNEWRYLSPLVSLNSFQELSTVIKVKEGSVWTFSYPNSQN